MAKVKDLTGKKYGRLTVVERAEDYTYPSGNKDRQWLCRCDCGNEIVVKKAYLMSGKDQSCGCAKAEKKANKRQSCRYDEMSEEEKNSWLGIYRYVENHVLKYDADQTLSKNMVLRIQGLQNGKYIASNNIENKANYSREVILNTFKFCNPDIQKKLMSMSFNDEDHKFNYILRIVEGKLNTVYMRMKNAKKVEEKIEKADITEAANYVNMFKPKKQKVNHRLDTLW